MVAPKRPFTRGLYQASDGPARATVQPDTSGRPAASEASRLFVSQGFSVRQKQHQIVFTLWHVVFHDLPSWISAGAIMMVVDRSG